MQKTSSKDIESKLDNIKCYLDSKNIDYYDIRLDNTKYTFIEIENKESKNVESNKVSGIGIRVLVNGKLGFCSTNNIENYKKIIDSCIEKTKKLTKITKLENFSKNKDRVKHKHKRYDSVDLEKKVKENIKINSDFLKQKHINKILNISTYQMENYTERYFVNPYSYIYQEKPKILYFSKLLGKRNNIIETSYHNIGNIAGLELINHKTKESITKVAEDYLNDLLISKSCPALKTDIILDDTLVGIFAHEAIGHSSEADAIISKESTLKKGLVVSNNKEINIIDDPTINRFGQFKYDDEGIKAKKTRLIEKGVVKNYLTDIETATELGEKSNGSARIQSYKYIPIVRMSNTYFEAGKTSEKDMLNDFTGYYLKKSSAGQVSPSVGTFTFGVGSVQEYKKGKVINNYKQATISGTIINYLQNITEVSKNVVLHKMSAHCGKDGQSVPVSDGGPILKIKNVVVGGTKHE